LEGALAGAYDSSDLRPAGQDALDRAIRVKSMKPPRPLRDNTGESLRNSGQAIPTYGHYRQKPEATLPDSESGLELIRELKLLPIDQSRRSVVGQNAKNSK
jgi:hypothetical protein